ncbi:MAG TPA: bifunctional diaminohydroxyphosphoribosylaminopyrimidine deaminase/5-amino-6-(5-phosphoribosylamino)uracil reductase RibD [Candidatus Angelobacter sp.]|jgi:diaminohydroxyphosphoribosylaminopyrimidine deaminase/5-amino-6-(5-phosphoribosylamino)uracil reductase|nr:bifunctional diaminohydroxyphosphoribosylaminopyrimidine deaminase/5-amino-6-(5-phosphoribosylamino)uracil reductase RibD [Candidatus Angelobacter sp.]
MAFSPQDELFMRQALELARRGAGLTSPGARVGAVIVDSEGNLAGSGFYTFNGIRHAEILALEQAGSRARGGTIYLTLEPHCHQGRTPPCTDALIAAGIARVVAAMDDPNPKVAGKGFAQLRAAGIKVETGLLESEARHINEAFARYILAQLPLVTLKSGMTLDGKIAGPQGGSVNAPVAADRWITSKESRAHAQSLRHESDAILVGAGTIVADDPLLTDRTGLPRRRPLLRVVLDSRLRCPLESRLVETAKDDVLIFCSFAEEKKRRALEARGVRVEQIPLRSNSVSNDGRPDLGLIVARLGALEITSLLIEGGALVNWAALAADVVDKVFLYYAPKILAGSGSVPFAGGEGFHRLSEAAQIKDIALHRFAGDFAVEGYLHDPYAPPEVI